MSYDTPLGASGQQLADLPLREQMRRGFKDMGSRSFSSAKNFGLVGAIFAGTECCIEGVRQCSLIRPASADTSNGSIEQKTISRTALQRDVSLEASWVQKLDRKPLLLDVLALLLSVLP